MMVAEEIQAALVSGDIHISPFDPANLGPNSYDVRLGEWFYREQRTGQDLYNPFDFEETKRVWGYPLRASYNKIVLLPGENILAHTIEFIGGARMVSSEMHARSSIGRNFLTVCRCAGFGDVGYINRWTMEITNNSQYHAIVLRVGMRVAQIQFTRVADSNLRYTGKYQSAASIDEMVSSWVPEMMLPRLDRDREVSMINE